MRKPIMSKLTEEPFLSIDRNAMSTWIYPVGVYEIRKYQRVIIEYALLRNTLVCLPTGLGKTFIAAVVMFNFHRWFPSGKVVFMAPTKPLVNQQVKACHDITGISENVTARVDGSVNSKTRERYWHERSIFYCTPQTLKNDIEKGNVNVNEITCVVVDEAHKASGNYAYVSVIDLIDQVNPYFRVLALSATPGKSMEKVQEVVHKLKIKHLEVRTDNDPDVKPYIKNRLEEIVTVKSASKGSKVESIGKLFYNRVISIFVDRLKRNNVQMGKVTKGSVYNSYQMFKDGGQRNCTGNVAQCHESFSALLSLAYAADLLRDYGLSEFCQQLEKFAQDPKSSRGARRQLVNLFEWNDVKNRANALLKSGAYIHPKMVALYTLLTEHFGRAARAGKQTRVIVFAMWRNSVVSIVNFLKEQERKKGGPPTLKPHRFVGQSSGTTTSLSSSSSSSTEVTGNTGMNQKLQEAVVRGFTGGEYNVLVSTSIGEEGLDIGQVDLIIAYDAVGSATRMTQRFGRTGRKRSGRVVTLATKDEKKKIERAKSSRKKIDNQLQAAVKHAANGVEAGPNALSFNRCNPRMLPSSVYPECEERKFEVGTFHSSQVAGIGASQSDLPKKNKRPSKSKKYVFDPKVTKSQEMFLLNEFGWDGKSTPGSVNGDDGKEVTQFVDREILEDLDDEEDGHGDGGSDGDVDVREKSYSIFKIDGLKGEDCSHHLYGEGSKYVGVSSHSKTLVSMLQRTKREEEMHDDDNESFGIQSIEAMEDEEINEDNQLNVDGAADLNGNVARARNQGHDYANAMDDYNDNYIDDFDHQDMQLEQLPLDSLVEIPAKVIRTGSAQIGVPIMIEESADEDEHEMFIDTDEAGKKARQENSLLVSNSQAEDEDGDKIADEDEDEMEMEMEMEDIVSAPQPNITVNIFQRGQRVELFDDGQWWKGTVAMKKKKRTRSQSTPHWVYDVKSSASQQEDHWSQAWKVYDVEPGNLRISITSMVHERNQFLGSSRRHRRCIDGRDADGNIDSVGLDQRSVAKLIPPPPQHHKHGVEISICSGEKPKQKQTQKKTKIPSKSKRAKRKRLRPVNNDDDDDDDDDNDDEDGFQILADLDVKKSPEQKRKKRKKRRERQPATITNVLELEAECDEEEGNDDIYGADDAYDLSDDFINDETPRRKNTPSSTNSQSSEASSNCSYEDANMMAYHARHMMASQSPGGESLTRRGKLRIAEGTLLNNLMNLPNGRR